MITIINPWRERWDALKEYCYQIDIRFIVAMTLIATFTIAIIIAVIVTISELNNKRSAHNYFAAIALLKQLDAKEYEAAVMKVYHDTSHPLYKMLLGMNAVMHLKEHNKIDAAKALLAKLMHIRNIPEYISDAIHLQMVGLDIDNPSTSRHAQNLLQSVKNKDHALFPLLEEMALEIKFAQKNVSEYHNGILQLYHHDTLPHHMRHRLEEMRYITQPDINERN